METVSWQYARRRKYKVAKNPHLYRYKLVDGVYEPIGLIPEKWVIKITEENFDVINKYRMAIRGATMHLNWIINSPTGMASDGAWNEEGERRRCFTFTWADSFKRVLRHGYELIDTDTFLKIVATGK